MISFKSLFWAAGLAAFFFSCSESTTEGRPISRGEAIVDSAIACHGGELYENVDLSFGFRGRNYQAIRQNGNFEYTNTYRDSLGNHLRRLTNDGFTQELNNERIQLSVKDSTARAASVNSVIYFALLPGMLKTEAAKKEFVGKEEIEGNECFKVRVTFSQEGGGEDFDDVFLYWFSTDNYAMDYIAYSYLEDEGGTRFRKAYNRRSVNGLVFQDYLNMAGPTPDSLSFVSDMFKSGQLDTLSRIEVDRLAVSPF
ncbi:deoxyribose-phosphate aldolase [Cryomorphaceae bacterium 1068]|nr:deoxyribose-phosphate aldolase [Cryomorphaceae bacterium 1068]